MRSGRIMSMKISNDTSWDRTYFRYFTKFVLRNVKFVVLQRDSDTYVFQNNIGLNMFYFMTTADTACL